MPSDEEDEDEEFDEDEEQELRDVEDAEEAEDPEEEDPDVDLNDGGDEDDEMEVDASEGDGDGAGTEDDGDVPDEVEGDAQDVDGDEDDEEDDDEADGDAIDADGADEEVDGDDDDDEDDDNDDDEEGEEDNDEDDGDDAEGGDEDVEMAEDEAKSIAGSTHSPGPDSTGKARSPSVQPVPPHMTRRSLFHPTWPPTSPPKSFSIEAIVGIPLPSPVHALASTSCLTHVLTGAQDGYVRVWDFWASVNGGQVMMPQQRTAVGLGEGVNKAGVGRGWWSVELERDGTRSNEPVYSLACHPDGLFSLAGTQINLYSLRHSPGHLIHTLKGHNQVVSCLTMLQGDQSLLSGSWDGTVKEWDLNTGQAVRSYPTHGAQISSVALRPFGHPPSPAASPNEHEPGTDGKISVSVNVGPDFFAKPDTPQRSAAEEQDGPDEVATEAELIPAEGPNGTKTASPMPVDGDPAPEDSAVEQDVPMEAAKTSRESTPDSLFDDEDAEGSIVPPSGMQTTAGSPAPSGAAGVAGLALPGSTSNGIKAPNGVSLNSASSSSTNKMSQAQSLARAKAATSIPLLSPASYRSFSEDVMLTSSMDGQVTLVDRRMPDREGAAGRLTPSEKAPPWCMSACWLGDGNQVLAGRRNGTVDVWDVRRSSSSSSTSSSSAPRLLRTLRTPLESGPISCLVALPDGKHVATASADNIRLWNMSDVFEIEESAKRKSSRPPFKIIAGHHGGIVSSMLVDPTSRFLISSSGDRGWQAGESTKVVLIHEIKW